MTLLAAKAHLKAGRIQLAVRFSVKAGLSQGSTALGFPGTLHHMRCGHHTFVAPCRHGTLMPLDVLVTHSERAFLGRWNSTPITAQNMSWFFKAL